MSIFDVHLPSQLVTLAPLLITPSYLTCHQVPVKLSRTLWGPHEYKTLSVFPISL